MIDQVYRKLARRLDSIPPGFPATESSVELQLLAKFFTREEAALISSMRLAFETAAEISARTSMKPGTAYELLERAARKGLLRTLTEGEEHKFALKLQTGGIIGYTFEQVLGRTDAEAAALYVQWVEETRGGGLSDYPAARRVIPVDEAIPLRHEIHPFEQASYILDSARSWGVADCMCRTRTRLVGQGCSYPLEACLFTSPDEGTFEDDELVRAISHAESLRILRHSSESGLVHTTANLGDYGPVICNCCPCCCPTLRGIVEFNRLTAVVHSDFRAMVDDNTCDGCGDCVEHCHFDALSVPDDLCVVDPEPCMGCGLCAAACLLDALSLLRRPQGQTPAPPADLDEWTAEYASRRGIPLA